MSEKEQFYYAIRSRKARIGESRGVQRYTIIKFDDLLNPTGDIYDLTVHNNGISCDCPGGRRPNCRHREMFKIFTDNKALDTLKFYCYDTGSWTALENFYDPA